MGRENEIKAHMEIVKIDLSAAVGVFLLALYSVLSNIEKMVTWWPVIGTLTILGGLVWSINLFRTRYLQWAIALDQELKRNE